MIYFFRRTRKELMDNHKAIRYLKYAVGEIVLVVIGILIALQLNNFKETRNNDQKERDFLGAIHMEFLENRIQLDTVVLAHKTDMEHLDKIIDRFPVRIDDTELDSLQFHLQRTFTSWTFNPSEGSISALINTSSFNLIKNDSLRHLLVSWHDLVTDYSEDEKYSKDFQLGAYDQYFSNRFEFDFDLTDPRFDQINLHSLKFEYMIQTRRALVESILIGPDIKKLNKAINDIVRFTEPAKN